MAKKCAGLSAKGRLMSGYRWVKGAKCPKKAKGKGAISHAVSGKKRGRPRKGVIARLLSPWEWFSQHGKSASEQAALERNIERYQELHGSRKHRRR